LARQTDELQCQGGNIFWQKAEEYRTLELE